MTASNRQKKLLRFFFVPFSPNISDGAAGWEIDALMHSEANRDLWKKYLFVTSDFDSDTDELKPFDRSALESVVVPDGWDQLAEIRRVRDEVVASEMADGSPFDNPQPPVTFTGCTFVFTGNFAFGSKSDCHAAVEKLGGRASDSKSVSANVDFLVVGTKGSKTWKHDSYGNKIQGAILARRERGNPAIISEEHWQTFLGAEAPPTQ